MYKIIFKLVLVTKISGSLHFVLFEDIEKYVFITVYVFLSLNGTLR